MDNIQNFLVLIYKNTKKPRIVAVQTVNKTYVCNGKNKVFFVNLLRFLHLQAYFWSGRTSRLSKNLEDVGFHFILVAAKRTSTGCSATQTPTSFLKERSKELYVVQSVDWTVSTKKTFLTNWTAHCSGFFIFPNKKLNIFPVFGI